MGEIANFQQHQADKEVDKAIQEQINKKFEMYKGDFKRFELWCQEQGRGISFDSMEKYLHHTIAVEDLRLSTFNRRAAGVKFYLINKYQLRQTPDEVARVKSIRSMYNNTADSLKKKEMVGQKAKNKEDVMTSINKLDTRAKAISLVNLVTANRPSEMLLLHIGDFDLDDRSVTVVLQKQKSVKTKRLTPEAVEAIKAYIQEYDLKPDDLFVGKVDKWNNYTNVAISDTAYRKAIHKWLGFAPYTLRKTQISSMHNDGASLEIIATQSGHQSLETITKHYLEVNDTRVDKYL